MKNLKEYEAWLAVLFNYDEDEIILNFDDMELYKEFQQELKRNH